jgi:hypothetical protein
MVGEKHCIMKTLMNQFKFGTLLTVFIFLSFCMGDATNVSITEQNKIFISNSNQSGGNQTKIYRSIQRANQLAGLTKAAAHHNEIITAFPIFFGTVDAVFKAN